MTLRRKLTPRAIAASQDRVARQLATPGALQVITVDMLRKSIVGKRIPQTEQYRSMFGAGLTLDRIAGAIEMANNGAMRELTDLSRETVDVDPHLSAVLNKRFGAVAAFPYEFGPASGEGIDDEKARFYAEVVQAQVEGIPNFSSRVRDLAWGVFDGRAVEEIDWAWVQDAPRTQYGQIRWVASDLAWVHPRRISFGPRRELRLVDSLLSQGFTEAGVAFGEMGRGFKFVEFSPRLFGEYPEREGLARRCLYWSFFKRFAAKERMILLELFSKPWRWLEQNSGENAIPLQPDEVEKAEEFIEGIAGNGYGALPMGVQMKTESPEKGSGTIHNDVTEAADKQISKLVLGQTGTTDAQTMGLGSNLALVLANEQFMSFQADAAMLSEAFQTYLVNSIIALNFGADEVSHAPTFRIRADVRDRKAELERLKFALDAGMAIKRSEAYEIAGFEIPSDEDVVIQMVQPASDSFGALPPPRAMVVYPKGKAPAPDEREQEPTPAAEEEEEEPGGVTPPAADAQPSPGSPPSPGGDELDEVEEDEEDEPPRGGALAATRQRVEGGMLVVVQASAGMLDDGGARRLLEALGPGEIETVVRAMAAPVTSERRSASEIYPTSVVCQRQPETTFGSPEVLFEKGVKELAKLTERMAQVMIAAGEGARTFSEAYRRITAAAREIDVAPMARAVERRIFHGSMLGALDSAFERDHETLVKPATFAAPPPITAEPAFANMNFADAAKFFRGKKVLRKEDFAALEAGAKRRAFTVARLADERLLEKVHAKLGTMIADGFDMKEFRRFMEEEITTAGWTPANSSHIETIARTNIMQAYSVGRIKDMTSPTVLRTRPFWQIRCVADDRARDTHKAVNNWVLRATDNFFDRAFPGNFGFNCRCRAVSLSERQVSERGLVLRSGTEVKGLPDEGFGGSGLKALISEFS